MCHIGFLAVLRFNWTDSQTRKTHFDLISAIFHVMLSVSLSLSMVRRTWEYFTCSSVPVARAQGPKAPKLQENACSWSVYFQCISAFLTGVFRCISMYFGVFPYSSVQLARNASSQSFSFLMAGVANEQLGSCEVR